MQNSNKGFSRAFSLIELSVVILIISILITGTLSVSTTGINNAKVKVTKERMKVILEAIANYLGKNGRLPCPAELNLARGNVNYGKSLDQAGDCHTDNTGVYTSGSNNRYGVIPNVDLGLAPEIAVDGFGGRFTYIMMSNHANSSTFDDGWVDGTPNPTPYFKVYNYVTATDSGEYIAADFIIISHGPNRFGTHLPNSTTELPQPTDIDEHDNTHATPYILDTDVVESSSRSDVFDDIVLSGVLTNMITKYRLYHVIKCKYTNYTDWDYGTVSARSSSTCAVQNEERLCNAFGQSVVVTPCKN